MGCRVYIVFGKMLLLTSYLKVVVLLFWNVPVDFVLNTHSPACGSIWKDVELLRGKDWLQKIDQ